VSEYGKVASTFWTGDTGRQIRKLGHEAQIIALYLMTCPSAKPIGFYYLPLPLLCHETGIPLEAPSEALGSPSGGALKALRSLSTLGFAFYDETAEMVWIPEMAHYQLGELIKKDDNRLPWLRKMLESHRKSPFYTEFFAKYGEPYGLAKPLASPLQAPSEALGSPSEASSSSSSSSNSTNSSTYSRSSSSSSSIESAAAAAAPSAQEKGSEEPRPETLVARIMAYGLEEKFARKHVRQDSQKVSVVLAFFEIKKPELGNLAGALRDMLNHPEIGWHFRHDDEGWHMPKDGDQQNGNDRVHSFWNKRKKDKEGKK
jgi:hypothetical protein